VKCVDTILRDGRVYVTMETIAGETPALTTQEQGKRLDMPVSRGKDLRDTNLRRTIEGELVEPIRVRRNKNRTYVECRLISPEQKARRQCWHQLKCLTLQKVNAACVIFLISCTICQAH